jgi:5-oxoprolinase (ATP-hydrolysing)
VTRHFRFLKNLKVSILSERRVCAPFGLCRGGPGKCGKNIRVLKSGKRVLLEGKVSYRAGAGEELIIHTPGGGGYGRA